MVPRLFTTALVLLASCGGSPEAIDVKEPEPVPKQKKQVLAPAPKPEETPTSKIPKQETVPDLASEWWKGDEPCPEGSKLKGRIRRALRCQDHRGIKHGLEILWRGGVVQVMSFRDGAVHGPYAIWNSKGLKVEEGLFDSGHQEGYFFKWRTSGERELIGHFRSDQRDGEWTYYDESGAATRRVRYQSGRIVEETSLEAKKE